MITTIVVVWLSLTAFAIYVGYKWQARKSPQQQHLDFLIDANDPRATQVAIEMWGAIPVTLPDKDGKRYALL